MKNLVKKFFIVVTFFALTIHFGCDEESSNPSYSKEMLNAKWKLIELTNVSDLDKYLNTVVEFNSNGNYSSSKIGGAPWGNGTFTWETNNTIRLSLGVFCDLEADLKISKLTDTNLEVEEHYTEDGKDVIIEYTFEKTN